MAKARPITGLDSTAPTARNARIILQQRLKEMYSFAPYIDNPDNIQELHNLRIAAKRVRYTLEVFEEFLPASAGDFARELATLQDELGTLHDSEVILSLLRQLLQPKNAGTSPIQNSASRPKNSLSLPGEIAQALLHPIDAPALSARERQGLAGFLQHQEQRRKQAYALFRQHWEKLEQEHFHMAILAMLNEDQEGQRSFL